QGRHQFNATVQILPPRGRKPAPVGRRERAPGRETPERLTYFGERDAYALRRFDDGDTAEDTARIAPLVAGGPPAFDQALPLVEMQRRHGHARALGNLADAEGGWNLPLSALHGNVLDLKFC